MPNVKINKNVILMIGIVVVIIAAYFTFFRKSDIADQLTSVESSQVPPVGQALIVELNRLKSLRSVGKDLFSNSIFVTLEDFTQQIDPQPYGRSNPFAPIGNE